MASEIDTKSILRNLDMLDRYAASRVVKAGRMAMLAAVHGAAAASAMQLVAEGDSWFDYPPGWDLIDQLRELGYRVENVGRAGSLLEDMVLGWHNDFDQPIEDFFERDPSQLFETARLVEEHRPRALLFSGGGNDIAGPELKAYINQKAPGVDPIRVGALDHVIFVEFRRCYQTLIDTLVERATRVGFPPPVIVGHGYDYPLPDERGVINIPGGFTFIGPWLGDVLRRKGYVKMDERLAIMRRIMDKLNEMLAGVAQANPGRFVHVDLRGTLETTTDHWANELHPTNAGFALLAARFHIALQSLSH